MVPRATTSRSISAARSTGPILPLVLSPTTLGEEMNVGVSYRIAGFSRQKIDGVMAMFMDQIEHPMGARRGPRHGRQAPGSFLPLPSAAISQPELVAAE